MLCRALSFAPPPPPPQVLLMGRRVLTWLLEWFYRNCGTSTVPWQSNKLCTHTTTYSSKKHYIVFSPLYSCYICVLHVLHVRMSVFPRLPADTAPSAYELYAGLQSHLYPFLHRAALFFHCHSAVTFIHSSGGWGVWLSLWVWLSLGCVVISGGVWFSLAQSWTLFPFFNYLRSFLYLNFNLCLF